MSKMECRFTQGDLTKAVKGARAGGAVVARIEIDKDGKIVSVITGKPNGTPRHQ